MKKSLKTRPAIKRSKETAKTGSPWSKDRIVATAGEETTVELTNPFADLMPDKIDPDKPPLSPVEKKPMLSAFIGPANGAKIPVWVAPNERIVLPRLTSKEV